MFLNNLDLLLQLFKQYNCCMTIYKFATLTSSKSSKNPQPRMSCILTRPVLKQEDNDAEFDSIHRQQG